MNRLFLISSLPLSLLMAGAATAQTVLVLQPTGDASAGYHDGYPSANTNYDNTIHFSAFCQPGNLSGVNKGRGLIKFDLGSIPNNATILAASLQLTGMGPFGTGTVGTVGHVGSNASTIRRITAPWSANTVTWNTQPTTTTQNMAVLSQSTYATQNYMNVDVTAMVQDMILEPSTSHGFMLQLNTELSSRGMIFHSTVGTTPDRWPTLFIVYGECEGMIGMDETENIENPITMYPNIGHQGSHVLISDVRGNMHKGTLLLTDATGSLVKEETIVNWPYLFRVPSVSTGMYSVTIVDEHRVPLATHRLVVQ